MPEITDNDLKQAIERQDAGIVFLNIILENYSYVLTFSVVTFELTLEKVIDAGTKLLSAKSYVPIMIRFHQFTAAFIPLVFVSAVKGE